MMKIYLVGGAVRDKLLNYPSDENDWVVVGATPEQMLELGYDQVGKDFPVFLHPETKDEYALARTERKTGHGYTGFSFSTDSDVTLEEDLMRRDLTINAIALAEDGEFVDPYGGQEDINNRILRHVSVAFKEDPVRILRVARFAARYHHLGFTIADETMQLMRAMVEEGEANHLVSERIWKEFSRALGEKSPRTFIETLRECGALKVILPELDRLFDAPQNSPQSYKEHHEHTAGLYCLKCLDYASLNSSSTRVRFAVLTHLLGQDHLLKNEKAETGNNSQEIIQELSQRLAVPNDYRDLASINARFHRQCYKADTLSPEQLYQLLKVLDVYRKETRFNEFLMCCQAQFQAQKDSSAVNFAQAAILQKALEASRTIAPQTLVKEGFSGAELGQELDKRRAKAIAATYNKK